MGLAEPCLVGEISSLRTESYHSTLARYDSCRRSSYLLQAVHNVIKGKRNLSNLAVVCNTTRCGGIYRVVSTLCNTWSRQGHQVQLIALYDHESFFHLEPSVRRVNALTSQETSRVARIKRKSQNLLARFLFRVKHFCPKRLADRVLLYAGNLWLSHRIGPLRAAIKRTKASVVIAFGWQANVLTILACRNLDRKIIISERGDVTSQHLEYPWERLRSDLYNYADIVTANTRAALQTMQTYVDSDKLAFIPNPLVGHEPEPDFLRPSFAAPVILIVANLTRVKAHDVLLETIARLSSELSNWRLALVGEGEQEKALREQAQILGIADRVDWHGRVADPVVFYRSASIFVMPSRSEGMPNALMEAMSYGVPVIVSNASPGPLDLVKDGETGLVVPVDDPDALASAIELLGNDASLRERLGDAGRLRVSEYDVAKIISLWEQLIATGSTQNQQAAVNAAASSNFRKRERTKLYDH